MAESVAKGRLLHLIQDVVTEKLFRFREDCDGEVN